MVVIFDWDGTLIDSAGKIVACMQQAARDADLPPPSDAEVRNIIGLGLDLAIHQLFPEASVTTRGALREHYSRNFIAADQTPCEFFPGVTELLSSLKAQGAVLAVATGKSRKGLLRVLGNSGFEHFFAATRCADETASKPDPLMLHELCEEFRISPEEAVMVGDTEYDLEMAKRIAMPSVGVSYGAHAPERLAQWEPLQIIDAFGELEGVLGRHYSIAQ
ncbi:phosphoglycolate phosphatase [Litorivivens lipolytica]|uniref:Phosphoglycolate phosphatase n=1 Tax=Litorivivens lipolytica TaxID=1524264 RepID=A0A7W4Z4W1_9GAMM|nr:HAD-IA family hydrolase [Litorivivens lipolytica]MBB3046548.1 phosphoglycolate phosphatase [Litorivivens lipolytica]